MQTSSTLPIARFVRLPSIHGSGVKRPQQERRRRRPQDSIGNRSSQILVAIRRHAVLYRPMSPWVRHQPQPCPTIRDSALGRSILMTNKVFDVLIIGSGHAGGMAAKTLTEKGIRCLMLNAGPVADV